MSLTLCRVCLTENAKVQTIRNTQLQEIYEKLSNSKLITEDGRAETVCCTCYSQLQKCHNFSVQSQKANDILRQLYCNGTEMTKMDVTPFQGTPASGALKNTLATYLQGNELLEENVIHIEAVKIECDLVKEELVEIEERFNEDIKMEDTLLLCNDYASLETPRKKPLKKNKLESRTHRTNPKKQSTPTSVSKSQKKPRKHVKDQKNKSLNKPYEKCDRTFKNSSEKHILSQIRIKHIACNECNATFAQKNTLLKHIKRCHTEKKLFNCDMCFKTFLHNNNLKAHKKIHIGEKLSVCDRCGKSFPSAYQLKRHMRSHTGEKPYKCEHCFKTFSDKGNLSKHRTNHLNSNRPFVCTECNASFSQKGNLHRHMRSHTGETPFLCDICQKSLPDASLLRRHMRIHTGEKPYLCNACGKAYSDKDNYKCHMRRHTGEKPYSCKLCDFKCAHANSLKYHLAKKHS